MYFAVRMLHLTTKDWKSDHFPLLGKYTMKASFARFLELQVLNLPGNPSDTLKRATCLWVTHCHGASSALLCSPLVLSSCRKVAGYERVDHPAGCQPG